MAPLVGAVRGRALDTIECAVIGPRGAGKTTWLASLAHQPERAHSFAETVSIEVTDPSAGAALGRGDFHDYAAALDGALAEGLRDIGPPISALAVGRPTFDLTLRDLAARRKRRTSELRRVSVSDVKADALLSRGADEQSEDARRAARDALANADLVMLCLPAVGPALSAEEKRDVLAWLRWLRGPEQTRAKRLFVTVTKFERLFDGYARRAYRLAATPDTALLALQRMVVRDYVWLIPALEAFAVETDDEILVQPVSAYGFVPFHGAANVDPSPGGGLLTRAAPPDSSRTLAAPYLLQSVEAHYWRPFLTMDPFIFAAAGEPGPLAFTLEEVSPE